MRGRLAELAMSALLLPALPALAQVAPATVLPAQPHPNQVVVTGTVPDEATRASVLMRLHELYGRDRVVDQIAVGSVVAPPNWAGYVQQMLVPDLQRVSRGELTIQGNQVHLKGEVANEALRQQVASAMATRLNPTYTIRNALRVVASEQPLIDEVLRNRIIEFEPGSSVITPQGQRILDELLPTLVQLSARQIEVIGHTDSLGARDANIALSFARADAVKNYLVSKGITPSRIGVSGAGPDRPIASNQTPEGRARNRRIEFRISQ
ncbi:OmpA family protein [Caldimonas thermodepolymerans]|uniref:OOP family OmpA-OmpF porin n=1 Tax=Caldimonas thermodepolymerans TaxID=215580 RepID=A0AA46DD10_9BURK|nr:OmpA family protein [Caldimonas thermodepolymerans]TCP07013.1 OOP family OmpA-OmpF porin [Caldimonas thermodepolymerans]UZG46739.1 OmpA family protein [Caldimonas thermodepolymerans]